MFLSCIVEEVLVAKPFRAEWHMLRAAMRGVAMIDSERTVTPTSGSLGD